MKSKMTAMQWMMVMGAIGVLQAGAAIRYVNVNSATPATPYLSWSTAARTIQEAVNAATDGDHILVTNGVYQTGVHTTDEDNRVAITKAVTVQSVNGPDKTVINGLDTVRCVWMTNGAVLAGFTLTNGVAYHGGGAYGGVVTNCTLVAGFAYEGGGAAQSTLYQCRIVSNAGYDFGGGAIDCILNDCILTNNYWAYEGGAAYNCSLSNCLVLDNRTYYGGDGSGVNQCSLSQCTLRNNDVFFSTLTNCTLTSLGAWSSTFTNCSLVSNWVGSSKLFNCSVQGGYGVDSSTLRGCVLRGIDYYAASFSTLTNCTLVGNGAGAYESTLYNCIVYYNGTTNYNSTSVLRYCCTTPLPASGFGNITAEPQLVDLAHIAPTSPCRGAGSAAYARGVDIDGESWLNPPSIGCDEFQSTAVAGPLAVSIRADYTNAASGFPVPFSVQMSGRARSNHWDFGDGTIITNRAAPVSHAWASPGNYTVVFRAFNDTYPTGVSASVLIRVLQDPTQYVSLTSTTPIAPYLSWATASTNIQKAIDGGFLGGTLVVSNGIYGGPGSSNLLAQANVNRAINVRSLNGPEVTTIRGMGFPCVYLADGASLAGFTLTNGQGNGVSCASINSVVTNCVLVGNVGYGASGGTLVNCRIADGKGDGTWGAFAAVLINCLVTNNPGGAVDSVLSNCVLVTNLTGANNSTLKNCIIKGSSYGAMNCKLQNCALTGNYLGAYSCVASNCTITANQGGVLGQFDAPATNFNCLIYYNSEYNYQEAVLNYCNTTPMPFARANNITNEPHLTDLFHISSISPCIGAGHPAYARGVDLDGQPWANPPSIGCDQFYAGPVTGPLTVSIKASFTNVATGFVIDIGGLIDGHASFSFWDFDDGSFIFDQPYKVSHSFTIPGEYHVRLVAYNNSYPAGVVATIKIHVLANPVQYVALNNPNPMPPYLSWATAATNIQDAIDHAFQRGTILVSNGVYKTGSRVAGNLLLATNRIAVTTPIALRSVNGPLLTTIDGGGQVRGAHLIEGASLTGFTLANGLAGVEGGTLSNCVIVANRGNGAEWANLIYCAVAANAGYGALYGTLTHCTVTGNGIGASAAVHNSILYHNRTNYYDGASITSSCTTPPNDYIGGRNIWLDPLLTDSIHLAAISPCRQAGATLDFFSQDIDGQSWLTPPSMGCDEFHSTPATGPLTTVLLNDYTNVAVGFPVNFTGAILGHAFYNRWDFGDGAIVDSQWFNPFATHTWQTPGDYTVVLRAYNGSYPAGISATVIVHVVARPIHHVALGNTTPVAPYTNWATAATNIQPAVDVATMPGALVLVSNGVYQTGTRLVSGISNRLVVTKPITVQSVNGAGTTVIRGGNQVRCAYLTNTAMLVGFTLSNAMLGNFTVSGRAAGVFGGTLSNCTVVANTNTAANFYGGGVYGATLINCTLTRNSAQGNGGGAHSSILTNCILTGNFGTYGGGAYGGLLVNCYLGSNVASYGGGAAAAAAEYNPEPMIDCVLTNNRATYGGGAYNRFLQNCRLEGNRGSVQGGGAANSQLMGCYLTNNFAPSGGGVVWSDLQDCVLGSNLAGTSGGGSYESTLSRCLLTGNRATNSGGGAFGGWLIRCTLTNNWAGFGGGASSAELNSCLLRFNTATNTGGGTHNCSLNNCTVTHNAATNSAGGISDSYAAGCVVYYNSAPDNANFDQPALEYCCTTPMPTNLFPLIHFNLTNEPGFVDLAAGNLRLQSSSPCINSGKLANPIDDDLEGNPRVAGGMVDIGAYEFQSPGSSLSYGWLQRFGLPVNGTADAADSDGDGFDNYHEWRAQTSPVDASSLLRMLSVEPATGGAIVSWQSVPGVSYLLERSTNLADINAFSILTWFDAQTNIASFTDAEANGEGRFFYRVRLP